MKRLFSRLQLLLVVLTLYSCNTTKYLDVDEFLLKKNQVKLQPIEKLENRRRMRYELSTLYKQKPNRKFFFIPREWFYFATQELKDTTRLDNWQRRVIAEPPSIFSEDLSNATSDAMRLFLNYKGFYDAEVFYDETIRKKKVFVTYYAYPGHRTLIDSVSFYSPDPHIDSILQVIKPESYLKKGEGLDGKLYELEKSRINFELRDRGYAYFYPYYIAQLEADTTLAPHRANLYLTVNPPFEDTIHRQYTIGEISIFPDYSVNTRPQDRRDTIIDGIRFIAESFDFFVRPQTILNAIYLKEGELYRQADYDRTDRRLNSLGVFKFVRIRQSVDNTDSTLLNIRIELTPTPRMELGFDFEFNYTNRSNTSGAGNLIGMSVSPSLSNRNLLRGAELLVSNISAGVEVNPNLRDNRPFWNTIDLRLQSDLYLPRFHDYLGIWKLAGSLSPKKRPPGERFYDALEQNAASRFSAAYNYVSLLDFYNYDFLVASYGYELQRSPQERYFFNNFSIDFFQPSTQPAFDTILQANPFLERSFGNQLFVSMLFRDFNYVRNHQINSRESNFLSMGFETAGAEIWGINKLLNTLGNRNDTLRIGNTDFSQYIRLEGDYRHYWQYTPKTALAARLSFGIARPFGFSTDVPYVKQFYVGGPNSIRAWAARGLGPGGHVDSLTLSASNPLLFYQTGDLKLEMSVEYRFNIFWRLNGALFLDAGNVWTIRSDPSRPAAQFLLSEKRTLNADGQTVVLDPFHRQIAVGGGFGARLDFTYFIFRLDFGMQLRYPYQWLPGRYWTDSKNLFRDLNLNFGLGFPF